MDKTFEEFLRLGIDLAPVGIGRREKNTPYFCTPKGASIFGWAGVDGIHFCFIRGFGGMVFSVSPMNASTDYVHPLSRDFADFLRLLLSCGDEAALEQAWMWDEAQFEDFLRKNPPTQEQRRALTEVSEKLHLEAMERPWKYLHDLQSTFDYGKIKYTEDFYDIDMNPSADLSPTKWEVYFDGNFWGHHGRDHAGTEIMLDKQFNWAGRLWLVPAAYACGKGLVVDFCMRVDVEDIRNFMEKWNLSPENDSCENFSEEQQMKMELENPLCFDFSPILALNGKALRPSHSCSVVYNPCLESQADHDPEAKWVVRHYGLDTSFGWVVYRNAFPWGTTRRPQIRSLSLAMRQQPVQVPGPHFKAQKAGDAFAFLHPLSGIEYTLTVLGLERQEIPSEAFGSDNKRYPTHMVAMRYAISPEPAEKISVCDCADGDRPMEIVPEGKPSCLPAATEEVAICVIGGADGPTSIVFGDDGQGQGKSHVACSSLHFKPAEDVEWRVDFTVKQFEGGTFALL